jgi:hypothetical protein
MKGLIVALIVSCNCKILRLYAQPRGLKKRKKNYSSLREGEGGRFGIISVTNPNYDDLNLSQSSSTAEQEQNMMKMNYTISNNLIDRQDHDTNSEEVISDFSGGIKTDELIKQPNPENV